MFCLQSMSPTGSQLSLLDVYLFVSLIFVFSTLLELAIVLPVKQTHRHLMKKSTGTRSISNCMMQSPKVAVGTEKITSVQTYDQGIYSWTLTMEIFSNKKEIRKNPKETTRLRVGINIVRDISLCNKLDIMAFLSLILATLYSTSFIFLSFKYILFTFDRFTPFLVYP